MKSKPGEIARLQHVTKAAAAAEAIRAAIFEGEMKPGDRLTVLSLAERMGISPTPIREAIRTLQAAGLVTQAPHRGAVVSDLPVTHGDDFYCLRSAIEGLAAERAAPKLTADDLDELDELHHQMAAAEARGDSDDFTRCNVAWHFRLYDAVNFPLLREFIFRIWTGPGWRPLLNSPSVRRRSMEQHDQMMAALRERNAMLVGELMRRHILDSRDTLDEEVRSLMAEDADSTDRRSAKLGGAL